MYIFKNSIRNIVRSMGRNILIGIIILVIAASCCIAISIGRSSDIAREEASELNTIEANITPKGVQDRSKTPDKSVLEKYKAKGYAKEMYYTLKLTVDGSGDFEPYSSTDSSTDDSSSTTSAAQTTTPQNNEQPGGPGGQGGQGGQSGQSDPNSQPSPQDIPDFLLTGYQSEKSMSSFANEICSVVSPTDSENDYFSLLSYSDSDKEYNCAISDYLAGYDEETGKCETYDVGDVVTVKNPENASVKFKLKIAYVYHNSDYGNTVGNTKGCADDANNILINSKAIDAMVAVSDEKDEDDNKLSATTVGTFVFATRDDYDALGEYIQQESGDTYELKSEDVQKWENQFSTIDSLKSFANTFLVVILIIGAIILIILQMFNIRERKYEIGVLTAMGMNKGKVALQFILETFIVTIVCIIIGTSVGAALSVPVTNSLLNSRSTSVSSTATVSTTETTSADNSDKDSKANDYNSFDNTVGFSLDFTVVLQMIGIGLLLTIFSSSFAVAFVMRYQPLKILTNRD